MNTATRVYGRNFAVQRAKSFQFSLKSLGVCALVLGLLMSALGVVYAKDLNRRLFIEYQNVQQESQNYQVEWNKLLLEQGAWSTQSRIQTLAQNSLNMVVPSSKNIVYVEDDQDVMLADNR